MEKRRKMIWPAAALLLLAAFGVAQATYTPMDLPVSSFWQGARTYTFDEVTARVEYAVYDTALASYSNIFDRLEDHFVNPGSGRYIYAYQITPTSGTPSISSFEVLGSSASAANGIGSQDDGYGGVLPTNNGSSFVWNFADGVLIVSKHSAFMVFSSNYSPVKGSVEFAAGGNNGNEPPTIPEPATLALLAIGGISLLKRKTA
jgi:hypothetical protein